MNRVILKAAAPAVMNANPRVEFADAKMEPVEGWACKYGIEIERYWGIMEIAPGAFADSITKPEDIRILSQHDAWQPIGIAQKFVDSDDGLYMEAAVNTETQEGREVMSNVKAGILAAFSVGFNTLDFEVVKVGEGIKAYEKEIITRAELKECSIVTFPAIEDARIEKQSECTRVRVELQTDYSAALAAADRILVA